MAILAVSCAAIWRKPGLNQGSRILSRKLGCATNASVSKRLMLATFALSRKLYLQFEVAGPTGKGGRGDAPLIWSTRRCGLTVVTWGVGEAWRRLVTSLDFVVAALSVFFFLPSSEPLLAAAPLGGTASGSGSVSAVPLIS